MRGLGEVAKPPVLAARGGCWFRGHGIELHLGVDQDFRPARKAHPRTHRRGLTPLPQLTAGQAAMPVNAEALSFIAG
jgi:hypothetical protein